MASKLCIRFQVSPMAHGSYLGMEACVIKYAFAQWHFKKKECIKQSKINDVKLNFQEINFWGWGKINENSEI